MVKAKPKLKRILFFEVIVVLIVATIAFPYFFDSSPSSFTVTLFPKSPTINLGESVNIVALVNGGSPPYIYAWYIGDIKSPTDSNTLVFEGATVGVFVVKCIVLDGNDSLVEDETVVTVEGSNPFILSYETAYTWFGLDAEQGVAVDDAGEHLYASATRKIVKWRISDGQSVASVTPTGYDVTHCGDVCYVNGYVYAPVTNYPSCTVRYVKIYDSNLNFIKQFTLDLPSGREAASISFDGVYFWIGDYNYPYLYKFDINFALGVCNYLETRDIGLQRIQGITWNNNKLYVMSEKYIHQFIGWAETGSQYANGAYEGIDIVGTTLYSATFHGSSNDPVYIFIIVSGI